jgi:DNA-binding PadR family transcriptional regulator
MTKISALALAVMGFLEERPRHPYDVAFTMQQRHMDAHIKLSLGTLYHTFEQLQRLGWVAPTETERAGRRPERTVYALTPRGRERFQERLRELIAQPANEYSSFEAGLAFIHHLPRSEAVALLRQRARAMLDHTAQWESVLDGCRERGLSRLSLIEVEMVQDLRRFQAEWANRIADEIESGSLEWVAGIVPASRQTPAAEEVAT